MNRIEARELAIQALKSVKPGTRVNITSTLSLTRNRFRSLNDWTVWNYNHGTVCHSTDEVIDAVCKALVD